MLSAQQVITSQDRPRQIPGSQQLEISLTVLEI